MIRYGLALMIILLSGCYANRGSIQTQFLTDACIKPLVAYHYTTCGIIRFSINDDQFFIPAHFETDLASIPKIAWPVLAPSHSSLIRPAIVHDWLYRKTCDFTRYETDLIFYSMLRSEGIGFMRASIMYYAVRLFGWASYNEDYCE